MKKKFIFLAIVIFIFFINSLMTFSERFINNLEQLEERNGKTYVRGEKEAFTGTLNVYRDGNWLFSEVPFKNGLRDGVQKDYYKSGKLRWSGFFKNGKREGSAKSFYENGNVEFEENHINGLQNGIIKEYYENGKIKSERPMKMGKKNGVSRNYHENGQLASIVTFKNDLQEGVQKDYFDNGNLEVEFVI